MYEWVRRHLAQTLRIDPAAITPQTRLGELCRDSLDWTELVCSLEEESWVGDALEGVDLEQMTVGELADRLERYREDGQE
jgi:acyl carrier protein